jgi:hypothetical protein
MKFGYLEWRDEKLTLVYGSEPIQLDIGKVPFDDVKYVKLAVDKIWQLALIKEHKTKYEFWFSQNGRDWKPYPDNPENHQINLDEDWYFLYPYCNSVAITKRQNKVLDIYFEGKWQKFSLPEGARWVNIEPDGGFLAVGSRSAIRVKNLKKEVACWRKSPESLEWEENPIIMCSWWNAYRTIEMGGFEQFEEADARMEPYVFASECSCFLDDRSWFIFIKLPNGKFYAHRLPKLMVDLIKRDSKGLPVVLASNYVENIMLTWSGKKWIYHDLKKPIQKLLRQKGYLGESSLSLSYDYHNNHLLAVGGISESNQVHTKNIVLQSQNLGLEWEMIQVVDDAGTVLFNPFWL